VGHRVPLHRNSEFVSGVSETKGRNTKKRNVALFIQVRKHVAQLLRGALRIYPLVLRATSPHRPSGFLATSFCRRMRLRIVRD